MMNARSLTIRDLIKVDPEYHCNQYGDYEAVKEYISEQLDAFTGDDLIKAWLVLDIFGDVMGECFVIPYGSPDPVIQAKKIKELIIDSLLEEDCL